jgi:predicted secreted protein
MSLTGGIVLFAVIWFLVFFIMLQIGVRSQDDAGDVMPGTPASAPADAQIGRKAKITTMITFVIWAIVAAVILSGVISIYDLDFFHRLPPPES